MKERFPLAPAVTEENRGVDPDVLRDIGYELPFDFVPEDIETTSLLEQTIHTTDQQDNVIGIEDGSSDRAAREMAKRVHPSLGNIDTELTNDTVPQPAQIRNVVENPQRGRNNDPHNGVRFTPGQEHKDAAVIGLAAAREALRNKRKD